MKSALAVVDVPCVSRKLYTSQCCAVVVWLGTVPPAHLMPAGKVSVPIVPASGAHVIKRKVCPTEYFVNVKVTPAVPIFTSCWLPFDQLIVMLVEVAAPLVYSAMKAVPVATVNCVAGLVVAMPTNVAYRLVVDASPDRFRLVAESAVEEAKVKLRRLAAVVKKKVELPPESCAGVPAVDTQNGT